MSVPEPITFESFYWFGARQNPHEETPIETAPENPTNKRPVLVFDTETTGLAGHDVAIQLAYSLDTGHEGVSETMKYLKLPRGVYISRRAASVHKITASILINKAVDVEPVLQSFFDSCERVITSGGLVVAHNAAFDRRIIEQTASRHAVPLPKWWPEDRHFFCTMRSSSAFCTLLTDKGRKKQFKNDELYKYFTGEFPKLELHDALNDVRVTLSNYRQGECREMW